MMPANATNLYRKSGGAQRRDLCVDALSWKCFSTERARISYHAELAKPRYAPFRRERRMRTATPTSSTGNPVERSGEICGSLGLSSGI
jgi:hypothetical protein